MAGRGTRLRPHTLTVPKPLIPVAGKPIIQRLVEDLAASYQGKIDEIAYIIGDFGPEVERELRHIATSLGARCRLYQQEKALGVGHAIACAAESMTGKCMVAFADTLFKADFQFDAEEDGIIWTQQVRDPSAFGVVKLDAEGYISDFVEKPATFVSDLAIVGIYYFRDGARLKAALRHIIDHDIKEKNEYQLTTALELLKNEGLRFRTSAIEEWLDCGNKDNILHANGRMLEIHQESTKVPANAHIENCVIVQPCFIGEHARIRNAVIGPYVSVGHHSVVENTVIANSIIQNKAHIQNALLHNSMIGNASRYIGTLDELNLGDYSDCSRH
jgi:glucose-1-phosphate thymidylyltransferase